MMTCKNCLYFNMCYVLADNPEEAEVEGAETDCSSFADRSRYVVREKGEWKNIGGDEWCCSVCGYVASTEGRWEPMMDDFCRGCGSDMRKGENDE